MNKGIANILKEALVGLPFIDKYGGLVYTQEKEDNLYDENSNGQPRKIITRFPVTGDYTITRPDDCNTGELIDFIPDQTYMGMLYFEDGGTDPLPRKGKLSCYSSKLQLIGWLNTKGLVNALDESELSPAQISSHILAAIGQRFEALTNKNVGNYLRLQVKPLKILPQSRAIFSAYNYDEKATQYLMPPFEFFAWSIAVEFCINPACFSELAKIDTSCSTPI